MEAKLIKQKYMTQETVAQNIKNQLKSSTEKEKTKERKRKPMHGKFYWDNERPSVGKEKSIVWLCCSGPKREMENLIIAAHDKALNTRYHQRNIMKQPNDSKCRMCYKAGEHIKHIVALCTTFVPSEYNNRHNKVDGYFHWMICKHMRLQVTDKYYEQFPEGS